MSLLRENKQTYELGFFYAPVYPFVYYSTGYGIKMGLSLVPARLAAGMAISTSVHLLVGTNAIMKMEWLSEANETTLYFLPHPLTHTHCAPRCCLLAPNFAPGPGADKCKLVPQEMTSLSEDRDHDQ